MSKLSFEQLAKNIEELRVINVAQRRKIGRRMARLAKSSAFQKKKERSKLKIASPEKQAVKARKAAKKIIIKKFFKNYDTYVCLICPNVKRFTTCLREKSQLIQKRLATSD